jgi:hypothetical protein
VSVKPDSWDPGRVRSHSGEQQYQHNKQNGGDVGREECDEVAMTELIPHLQPSPAAQEKENPIEYV